MGFRLNKSFKKYPENLDEIVDSNPGFKAAMTDEKITLKNSYIEKNPQKLGIALSRFKSVCLISAPICMYIGYLYYTITDSDELKKLEQKDNLKLLQEKKLLQD